MLHMNLVRSKNCFDLNRSNIGLVLTLINIIHMYTCVYM